MANNVYKITRPVRSQQGHTGRNRWISFGVATQLESGGFRCRIDSIPLAWDGEFFMYPMDKKGDEPVEDAPSGAEEKGA